MMNFKQKELAQLFFEKLKTEFPEIILLGIAEQPDRSIWVKVVTPREDDLEIIETSGKESMDIPLNYGYQILVIPFEKVK